jgi:hypothetical protein
MGLYNMIFGTNPASRLILATLDLQTKDVGRFRDCFISQGEIAVYTRNGGGNRECWHAQTPKNGSPECKHHTIEEERDIYEETTVGQVQIMTGKIVGRKTETLYVCEAPNTELCACPGCIIQHRLPKHPLYLRDEDDDFDSTYATIYFRFPEEFAEDLKKLDSGVKFEPSKRWLDKFEAMGIKADTT